MSLIAYPPRLSEPEPFQAHSWLRHPHLQTLAGAAYRRVPCLTTRREWQTMPDGEPVALDWGPEGAGQATLLILHGLSGTSQSPVVRGTMAAAARLGLRAVGINLRGALGPPTTPQLYHGGRTDDLDAVVRNLLARGARPLGVVGFSLGGNILLKWLGEQGPSAPPVAACAVCVPYSLGNCARMLETHALSRIYRYYMVRRLKGRVRALMERFPGVLSPQAVARVRTLTDFDNVVTAPLNGYRDAEHYWGDCSSCHYLAAIARPTLLINADDDPFHPAGDLPRGHPNPALTLEVTRGGGHLGYVGPGWRPWLEGRIARHFQGALRSP